MKPRLRVAEQARLHGYNMSSLSRKTDISFNTIKKYFRQPYEVAGTDNLGRIAEVLGVSIGDLVEMVEDEEEQ